MRCSAHAITSSYVRCLVMSLACLCHCHPISPPPRGCASAMSHPRSMSESFVIEKYGSDEIPYAPYASSIVGVGRRPDFAYERTIGIFTPLLCTQMRFDAYLFLS